MAAQRYVGARVSRVERTPGQVILHTDKGRVVRALDGGSIVERKTKRNRYFYGCENFPKCRFASWKKPVSEHCPTCGSILLENNKEEYICKENKHVFPIASIKK